MKKEDSTRYERRLNKDMEKTQKKESNRNSGNKKSFNSNKKYSCGPLQPTRKSGRQNLRARR
jgi:hypothetical protein